MLMRVPNMFVPFLPLRNVIIRHKYHIKVWHPQLYKGAWGNPAMAKHAAGQGKSAHAPAMENGVCIICGQARTGVPAMPEFPILAARKLRALLGQPAKHTVACGEHLGEARQRRVKYEKKARDYAIGAILFFGFVMLGSMAYGKFSLGLALPALLGAFFIALLPNFYYFPPFQE